MRELPKVSKTFSQRINEKKSSSGLKKYLLITLVVFLIVLFASGDYGLIKIYRLKADIKAYKQEIKRLQVKAVDSLWEIGKLKSDSSYICLYASEHFVYARPGVKVIQFLTAADTGK